MVLVTPTQAVALVVVAMSSQASLLTLLLIPVIGHVIAISTQMDQPHVLIVLGLTPVALVSHLLQLTGWIQYHALDQVQTHKAALTGVRPVRVSIQMGIGLLMVVPPTIVVLKHVILDI
jgi:hypothetical protein